MASWLFPSWPTGQPGAYYSRVCELFSAPAQESHKHQLAFCVQNASPLTRLRREWAFSTNSALRKKAALRRGAASLQQSSQISSLSTQ